VIYVCVCIIESKQILQKNIKKYKIHEKIAEQTEKSPFCKIFKNEVFKHSNKLIDTQ